MTRQPAASRVKTHPFVLDTEVSREWHGRTWCSSCGLPGEPGDERHPLDARPLFPPTPPEARALTARILGERDYEGEQP